MTRPSSLSHILENVPIASRTYYQMGGLVRYLSLPCSFSEVAEAIHFANSNSLPIAVLGTGSNSVFADETFPGLVISLEKLNAWFWETPEILYAEAGVTNTELSEVCLSAERVGASWMYRMPGQLGATVRMNARCYGGEISQIATEVVTMDVKGHIHTYPGSDIFKGYKDTLLMHLPEIVLGVRMRFPQKGNFATLRAHMEQCESDRHSKHHFDHPSCGSTFKNNYTVGKPSGRVFDELGLKGTSRGNAAVSEFHANFVWNLGNARTRDMLELAAHMRERALAAGADLELEVQPIGKFDDSIYQRCALQRLGPSVPAEDGSQWVGLLKHPAQKQMNPTFPVVLVHAPFQEYARTPNTGVSRIEARLEQLCPLSEAQKNPDAPFLRWTTLLDDTAVKDFPLLPKAQPGTFLDELWNYSVSEVFFAHPTSPQNYMEFESTPESHWIALRFSDRRKRDVGFETLSEKHWNGLQRFKESNTRFGLTFSYNLLKRFIGEESLKVQSMLSLGNSRYLLAPHWKAPACAAETWDHARTQPHYKPDFHQPERFFTVRILP